MPADDVGYFAEGRRVGVGWPLNAADNSANNHGLPRHLAADDDCRTRWPPSSPVRRSPKMSPLPSTGMEVTASLRRVIWFPVRHPEYRCEVVRRAVPLRRHLPARRSGLRRGGCGMAVVDADAGISP